MIILTFSIRFFGLYIIDEEDERIYKEKSGEVTPKKNPYSIDLINYQNG